MVKSSGKREMKMDLKLEKLNPMKSHKHKDLLNFKIWKIYWD
jgi:hypothetical protein